MQNPVKDPPVIHVEVYIKSRWKKSWISSIVDCCNDSYLQENIYVKAHPASLQYLSPNRVTAQHIALQVPTGSLTTIKESNGHQPN
jgi:hypothetical protein